MKHNNKVTQRSRRTQLGVRVNEEAWNKCKKLIIDLRISTTQFVEEALEDRAKRARLELKDRREAELSLPAIPIREDRRETV